MLRSMPSSVRRRMQHRSSTPQVQREQVLFTYPPTFVWRSLHFNSSFCKSSVSIWYFVREHGEICMLGMQYDIRNTLVFSTCQTIYFVNFCPPHIIQYKCLLPTILNTHDQAEFSLTSFSNMMVLSSRTNLCGGVLGFLVGSALGNTNSSSSPPSVTYAPVSGYTTQVYNASAATTTLSYNYTNEELAMLWNQVGKIAIGPITTTVSPTPEPSAYPRPGSLHPQVQPLVYFLISSNTGAGSNIRHESQFETITRQFHLGISIQRVPS